MGALLLMLLVAGGDLERQALTGKADLVLAAQTKTAEPTARRLTYRVIRGQCLALGVLVQLTPKPVHSIPEGREAQVRALVEAYRENLAALDRELAAARGPWRWLPDAEDRPALDKLGLSEPAEPLLQGRLAVVRRWQGQLVLGGYVEVSERQAFLMRPTPVELEPSRLDGGLQQLDEAAALFAKLPEAEHPDEQVVRTGDVQAMWLFILGRKEQAVTLWQGLLERYPKAKGALEVKSHLDEVLERNDVGRLEAREDRALAAAVAACDPKRVQQAIDPVVTRRYAEAGLWGVKEVLGDVERACGARPGFSPALGLVYFLGADFAARHGDCAMFERMAAAYGLALPDRLDRLRAEHPACRR